MWGARGSRRWQWEWSLPQAFKRLKSSSSSPVTLLVHASCLVWVEVLLASFEKVTRGPRPSASMGKTGRCSKDSQCSSDCESRLTLKVMVQPTIKLQSLSIRCNNLLTDMECSGMLWELLRHRKLNIYAVWWRWAAPNLGYRGRRRRSQTKLRRKHHSYKLAFPKIRRGESWLKGKWAEGWR